MSGHAEWSPEGKGLAVGAEVVTRAEPESQQSGGDGAAWSRPEPPPFAFEVRGVWPRRVKEAPREPSRWVLLALVVLIALMATIGVVAWINWPDIHRVGDLKVDLMIEGAWRFGKEAVSTE